MIQGILFDYDGTLAKTMYHHYKAWKQTLADFNTNFSKEEYYNLEGFSLHLLPSLITKQNITKKKIEELVIKKKKIFKKNLKKVNYYANTLKILKYLKLKNIKIALVSSSHLDQITASSKKNFLNNFDVIISGEDTKNNKPSPDPYLLGLKKLKLKPKNCLVIENAPIGITAAKKAGLKTIAITNTLDKKNLINADLIINDIIELKKYL